VRLSLKSKCFCRRSGVLNRLLPSGATAERPGKSVATRHPASLSAQRANFPSLRREIGHKLVGGLICGTSDGGCDHEQGPVEVTPVPQAEHCGARGRPYPQPPPTRMPPGGRSEGSGQLRRRTGPGPRERRATPPVGGLPAEPQQRGKGGPPRPRAEVDGATAALGRAGSGPQTGGPAVAPRYGTRRCGCPTRCPTPDSPPHSYDYDPPSPSPSSV